MLQLVSCHAREFTQAVPLGFCRRVTAPRHPGAQILLGHWRACVEEKGGVVIGRDIPAPAIAHVMQNVLIGEAEHGDIRLLLAGSAVRTRHGRATRVSHLSELFALHEADVFLGAANDALRTGRPETILSGLGDDACQEHVLLPASPCNGKSNWLVVGAFVFA